MIWVMGDLGPEERRQLDRMPDWVKGEVVLGQMLNDILAVVAGRKNPMEIARKWAERLVKFEQDSIRDPLTGVWNRGYVAASMSREMALARKHDTGLGLLFIDIDNFKDVNDGEPDKHQAGDRTLQETVKILNEIDPDRLNMTGRWGGEELVVVIADCNLEKLKRTGMDIGKQIAGQLATRAKLVNHKQVTVSIGAAMAGTDEKAVDFIRRADELMYQAKEAGKNRMAVADGADGMVEFGV